MLVIEEISGHHAHVCHADADGHSQPHSDAHVYRHAQSDGYLYLTPTSTTTGPRLDGVETCWRGDYVWPVYFWEIEEVWGATLYGYVGAVAVRFQGDLHLLINKWTLGRYNIDLEELVRSIPSMQ